MPDFAGRIRAVAEHACQLFDAEPALFAYLLISQHEHLGAVPLEPSENVVEALAGLLREGIARGEVPDQDVALASALALGCVVQPAVFVLYGRLEGPLMRHAGADHAGGAGRGQRDRHPGRRRSRGAGIAPRCLRDPGSAFGRPG